MASSPDIHLDMQVRRRWADEPATPRTEPSARTRPVESMPNAAEDEAAPLEAASPVFEWIRSSQSWLSSLIVHMVLLLILGLWIIEGSSPNELADLQFTDNFSQQVETLPQTLPETIAQPVVEPTNTSIVVDSNQTTENLSAFSPADDLEAMAGMPEISDFGTDFSPDSMLATTSGFAGTALSGRGTATRQAMVRQKGGTKQSEEAVAMALAWLAAHQNPDGSWNFQHTFGPCQGRCSHPGNKANAVNGATAIALLPFLGAGQTHQQGQYRETIRRGLYFLTQQMKVDRNGGSLIDPGGNMYSHGLGAIALCESYGMTRDQELVQPAQLSINFIQYAQDPNGGGWRYSPQQQGDTSVVGWQMMALKSGHMSYLQVNPLVVKKAYRFLDFVQANGGATYGYTVSGDRPATNAIGLLCRMFLGWKQTNPALTAGIMRIVQMGPHPSNMYYNYYATQAVFQYTGGEGSLWSEWNEKMREFLITTQSRQGHEKGSWFLPGDGHNNSGGRLYVTAMATMILEIYYRHMPIYQQKATEEQFPE